MLNKLYEVSRNKLEIGYMYSYTIRYSYIILKVKSPSNAKKLDDLSKVK